MKPARAAILLLTATRCLAQSAPTEAAARAEVEGVLRAMESSAVAGDAAAFLRFIDDSDPRFAMEMRHWADDLKEHRPTSVTLGVIEDGAVFDHDLASFAMRLSFRCPFDENGAGIDPAQAPERTITFPPVEFVRTADGWKYRGERWMSRNLDGFEIRFLAGAEAVADEVAQAFPSARAHADEGFEIAAGTGHQVIKLYRDMEHLKCTVYLSMPDPVLGGWNEPGESIKFMEHYTRGVRSWTRAFAHEYGHVCTWELAHAAPGTQPWATMPWWVAEGVAELSAETYDGGPGRNQRIIMGLAAHGKLPAWGEIADYRTTAQPLKYLAYEQGHHMLGYLSERFGRTRRNRWVAALASGRSLEEASRETLGTGFDELDSAWRDTLRAPTGETP